MGDRPCPADELWKASIWASRVLAWTHPKTIELLPDLFADKDDEVIEVEAEVENAE